MQICLAYCRFFQGAFASRVCFPPFISAHFDFCVSALASAILFIFVSSAVFDVFSSGWKGKKKEANNAEEEETPEGERPSKEER